MLCAAVLASSLAQSETTVGHHATPIIEIRASPIVDLYFFARGLASSGSASIPDVAGSEKAIAAALDLQRELGSGLAWGPIDGLIGECTTGKELRVACGRARETLALRSGKTLELRTAALRFADALEAIEPVFLEKIWPAHLAEIHRVEEEITARFEPKEAECIAYVAKHFQLDVPKDPLRVRLVYEGPPLGAVTQRDDDGRGVSFVAVHGAAGTQLFETILHETTHTLDIWTAKGSVLDDLRERLEKGGFTRQDREWRDVPHTLMFVQAGETIRRIVDPKHEHYGVVAHYYDKVKEVADIERPLWIEYLDGKLSRDEALERIARAVSAAKRPR
jgi:hypothetical protein